MEFGVFVDPFALYRSIGGSNRSGGRGGGLIGGLVGDVISALLIRFVLYVAAILGSVIAVVVAFSASPVAGICTTVALVLLWAWFTRPRRVEVTGSARRLASLGVGFDERGQPFNVDVSTTRALAFTLEKHGPDAVPKVSAGMTRDLKVIRRGRRWRIRLSPDEVADLNARAENRAGKFHRRLDGETPTEVVRRWGRRAVKPLRRTRGR